jgi:hypothetical protein
MNLWFGICSERSLKLVHCAIVAFQRLHIVAFAEQNVLQYSLEAKIVHFVPSVQFKTLNIRSAGKYWLANAADLRSAHLRWFSCVAN